MQTSASSFAEGLLVGAFQTSADFQQGLVTYFRTQCNAAYPNQIANVTFISQNSTANGGYILTFRLYFNSAITVDAQRTAIASQLQTTYYSCISKYFTAATKSMTIPTSVNISVPTAVSTSSKKAVLTSSTNSSKSVLSSSSLLTLTQVSSSSKDN
jgi:hypothetical protein